MDATGTLASNFLRWMVIGLSIV
ncbi:hypothetical protein F383_09042 [Gossypium arboreum]|uniref:Uncharacterized protein n=1 Tax=Gossypium arboreum TaxID=29729 RepID=A0A0B0NYU8_GOSAR|nr:hypothetical protein F383_09042 [Gossypium arboreum]